MKGRNRIRVLSGTLAALLCGTAFTVPGNTVKAAEAVPVTVEEVTVPEAVPVTVEEVAVPEEVPVVAEEIVVPEEAPAIVEEVVVPEEVPIAVEEIAVPATEEEAVVSETEEIVSEEVYDASLSKKLMDSNGVKITATGYSEDSNKWMLKLRVENKSGKSIRITTRRTAINGLMIDGSISMNAVANGKTATGELYFYKDRLKQNGISKIGTVVFDLKAYDSSTYTDLVSYTTSTVTINSGVKQAYSSDGTVLYNKNGVKIVLKGLEDQSGKSYVYYDYVLLYIENNSKDILTVYDQECSVNDVMINPGFIEAIRPGYKLYGRMSFSRSELAENGISAIKKIETKFVVSNENNYNDGFTTPVIKFNPKTTSLGSWAKTSGKWWWKRFDGTYPKSEWEMIDGKWYRFDKSGYMLKGWQKISKKWYYLGTDGAMRTGWQKISKKWYYFESSGAMVTGWKKLSGKWYYFETSGVMLAGTSKKIGGKTYRFNASGVCTNP